MPRFKIRKAIIPVAGFGTRFLPATKVSPKEMLAVVDKPVIQYLVEEAVDAGIETIIFVINSNKHIIGDHFSRNLELESLLRKKGKKKLLASIRDIHTKAEFLYVHQSEPLGTGDALQRAKGMVGDEPFAVFYADDIIVSPKGKPAIGQLMRVYERYGGSVLGLARVKRSQSYLYGMAKGTRVEDGIIRIDTLVEQPQPKDAPSTFASIGRHILTPAIWSHIPKIKKTKGEFKLTDAIARLADSEEGLYGREIDGAWYDCGSKFGFWRANLELGLTHPEIGREAKKYLRNKK